MIRKKRRYALVASLLLLCFTLLAITLFTTNSVRMRKQSGYSLTVFRSGDDGWGYQILKNKKVVLHQPYMPCIAGNTPFPTEKSAHSTAELVITKLKKTNNPTITPDELIQILRRPEKNP